MRRCRKPQSECRIPHQALSADRRATVRVGEQYAAWASRVWYIPPMATQPMNWPAGAPGDTLLDDDEVEERLRLREESRARGEWPIQSDPRQRGQANGKV
jgi:hypothetical protein